MRQKQREIPFLMKTQLIFGQPMSYIGLFIVAFGFIFVIAFMPNADLQAMKFDKNSPIIDGVITHVESTNASENKKRIYAYHYTCSLGEGVSYRTSVNLEKGEQVAIQHVASNPKIHRIKGMRSKPFDILIVLFVSIFPLIGALLAALGIDKGFRAVNVLQYGEISYGKYLGTATTNMAFNGRRVYRMFFEFKTKNGETQGAIATTNSPQKLADEQTEQLFYLPDNPEKNFLIDEFSHISKFDQLGYPDFKAEAKHFLPLILPIVILLEVCLFFMQISSPS